MKKQTIEKKIKKLEEKIGSLETKSISSKDPNGDEWVTIGYNQIPKETFDRYGAKPFQIMKRKMRKGNDVWNYISWTDAKAEAEKLGLRPPHITEMLVLFDAYKREKGDKASKHDRDFLGIEELSHDEAVSYEFVDGPSVFLRGDGWDSGSDAGAFALGLDWGTGYTSIGIGFRCARSLKS